KLLGFQVLEIDREAGTAMARFQARKTFGNQLGTLQGGIIAAMLDEVLSLAAVAKRDFAITVPTLEMKVSFLSAAEVGTTLIGRGRAQRVGKAVAFTEGQIETEDGRVIATATATALVRPWAPNEGMRK
ncbi:MAG: PaaI family thioesterase, partial [Alphaproteobacteria bacterium]|nr:PaaI family thioesterase [Alphaproteobacteria bacterium]